MIVLQKLVEEIAVPLGDAALEFFERKATFLAPDVPLWNDQVDAEGFASALSGENLQCLIELLWLHTVGSQHAKAASLSPSMNNCRTKTENKSRDVDTVDFNVVIDHILP